MPAHDSSTMKHAPAVEHCGYCGHPLAGVAPVNERFGERFCSEAHAEQFAEGVRAARMENAAQAKSATQARVACRPRASVRGVTT